jgi:zinc protease
VTSVAMILLRPMLLAALILSFAAVERSSAYTPLDGPEHRVAENVIVVPDQRARVVTGWLIVGAGCADEAFGDCRGVAHYLEHLLFINRDSDNKAKVTLFPDGTGNGWTTHRATVYLQRFPANGSVDPERLDKLFGFFAGMLKDVRADEVQAKRERNVVLQEYQLRTGRSAFARFRIKRDAALMPGEPYGQPPGGTPDTIKTYTVNAARNFHSHWYATNNAVIVLHGPVDPTTIAPLVSRHLGPLPVKYLPSHIGALRRDYKLETVTLRTKDKRAKQTGVYYDKIVTFPEPPSERRVNAATRNLVSRFLASRLSNSPQEELMVQDELYTQGRLSIRYVRAGTLRINFWSEPAPGVRPEQVIDAIRDYISRRAVTGIEPATIDRLKRRMVNERSLAARQPSVYASQLVQWLSTPNSYDNWLRQSDYEAEITPISVKRVLHAMALPGREVIGIIEPAAGPDNTATGGKPTPTSSAAAP